MRFLKTKLITVLTLMLCMGVFCITAYASDNGETLTVTAAWVDGELLRINVTDAEGNNSVLALRLSDYVSDSENKEYISIQAIDLAGNKSGVIEIKNPFYDPASVPDVIVAPAGPPQDSQSAIPDGNNPVDGLRPFTPDGAGTVVDNAHDGDGKEFFTIGTESGDVFYLIVDRQRNADNVYLLNAVTEEDLMALAEKNGREIAPPDNNGTSAITTPEPTETPNEPAQPADTPEPTEEPAAKPQVNSDTGMYILIGIIALAVGGTGYYLKIVKGRKNDYDDDDEEEEDEDDMYGYKDEPDDSDDEDGDGE